MRQLELFIDERSLFEKLTDQESLKRGFKAVKKNGGKPGIDGITIAKFKTAWTKSWVSCKGNCIAGPIKPEAVRRVEIPKPGKGTGVRLLGIPCIRDRVVQATLKNLLEPILEPCFSNSS